MEEGVISISLRWMTLVATGLVAFVICGGTYIAWYLTLVPIDETHWPFISDISCMPYFDRAFCLVFMFYALSVQQANVRAYYLMLSPYVSATYNYLLFGIGILACLILPLIYYWDEYWFLTTHDALALIFFFL